MGRLFWKFFLAFWLALLLAAAGTGTGVWLHKRSLEQEKELPLAKMDEALWLRTAALAFQHGGNEAVRHLLSEQQRTGQAQLLAVDAQGHELLGRPLPPHLLEHVPQGQDSTNRMLITDRNGQQLLLLLDRPNTRTPPPPAPREHATKPPPPPFPHQPGAEPPKPPAGLLLAFGLLASLAFSALAAWYLSRPIRNLRWALRQVEEGRLDTRVHPLMGRHNDEIGDLGADFDRMAHQLETLVNAQKRLLHDVSHELRSPLARLRIAVELARQQPGQIATHLDRIEHESARLDRLVGEVLTLARLESGMTHTPGERFSLGALLADVVEDARFEATESGCHVELSDLAMGKDQLFGEPELLHRALDNIIRNALQHSPAHGQVAIHLSNRDGKLVLSIADNGPGVPENELHSIFEPFHRGRHARKGSGYGLGLAIARRAIERHAGSIAASNRPEGGLCITIEWPRDEGRETARVSA